MKNRLLTKYWDDEQDRCEPNRRNSQRSRLRARSSRNAVDPAFACMAIRGERRLWTRHALTFVSAKYLPASRGPEYHEGCETVGRVARRGAADGESSQVKETLLIRTSVPVGEFSAVSAGSAARRRPQRLRRLLTKPALVYRARVRRIPPRRRSGACSCYAGEA